MYVFAVTSSLCRSATAQLVTAAIGGNGPNVRGRTNASLPLHDVRDGFFSPPLKNSLNWGVNSNINTREDSFPARERAFAEPLAVACTSSMSVCLAPLLLPPPAKSPAAGDEKPKHFAFWRLEERRRKEEEESCASIEAAWKEAPAQTEV